MMDRRELLYRASMLLGTVVTASAASGILAGCTTAPDGMDEVKSGFLTAEETATVSAMADQIRSPSALTRRISTGSSAAPRRLIPCRRAGITRVSLKIIRSPGRSRSGRSRTVWRAGEIPLSGVQQSSLAATAQGPGLRH